MSVAQQKSSGPVQLFTVCPPGNGLLDPSHGNGATVLDFINSAERNFVRVGLVRRFRNIEIDCSSRSKLQTQAEAYRVIETQCFKGTGILVLRLRNGLLS